eukprot:m.339496 g.339496  ORF g.339496 m.339496 type:complete len:50 (+) comp16095_c2_seq4:7720-7869(+)
MEELQHAALFPTCLRSYKQASTSTFIVRTVCDGSGQGRHIDVIQPEVQR